MLSATQSRNLVPFSNTGGLLSAWIRPETSCRCKDAPIPGVLAGLYVYLRWRSARTSSFPALSLPSPPPPRSPEAIRIRDDQSCRSRRTRTFRRSPFSFCGVVRCSRAGARHRGRDDARRIRECASAPGRYRRLSRSPGPRAVCHTPRRFPSNRTPFDSPVALHGSCFAGLELLRAAV